MYRVHLGGIDGTAGIITAGIMAAGITTGTMDGINTTGVLTCRTYIGHFQKRKNVIKIIKN